MASARAEQVLRYSVAFVWLATGLLVLHPGYRAVGDRWLAPLGLPSGIMFFACAGEVALGVWLLARPMTRWLCVLQTALVAGFTVVLAALEPMLLVHPLGVLSKNLPLLALVWLAWLLSSEGWTARATTLLRLGVAVPWLTEGIFPKLLFQQPLELDIVERLGLASHASSVIAAVGVLQALSGVAALLLRGRALRLLLWAQALALALLPLLVGAVVPEMWIHPFGPLTKTVPILVGTVVLVRRCSSGS